MNIEIVLKKGCIFESEEALAVTLQTSTGRIQILPNHENLITELSLGEVIVKLKDKEQKIAILGGLAEISNNSITILAEDAHLPEHIISDEIDQAIERAQQQISTSKLDPTELIQLEKQLRYQKFIKEFGSN